MRTAVTASNASHTRVGTPAGNRVSDAVRWLDHRVAPVMTMLVIPHGLFPETFGPGAATLPEMRADMAKRDAARSEREATARRRQTAIMTAAFCAAPGVAGLSF